MRVIEVCPKCGADLIDIVLTTYPPRAKKVCSKCDWCWTEGDEDVIRVPFIPPEKRMTVNLDCCRDCGNNPANGGSGICNCTLPYMNQVK